MNAVFAKILEMSLYGSIAILVVLLFRLIFRNLPKRVLIVFWMIVAVRLLLPINFASPTSLLNVSRLFESRGEKTTIEQIQKNSDEDLNAENKAVSADSECEARSLFPHVQTIPEREQERYCGRRIEVRHSPYGLENESRWRSKQQGTS